MKNINFDAVIFDLDGVITQTADVHSKAWKRMFDEFLKTWAEKNQQPFREFTHEQDYLPYVDGKPRYKGVASFLESRGINIPFGNPEDPTDKETVCGLGNRKNEKFNETLQTDGVKLFSSTVDLIKELKAQNIKVGVASSSKNCKVVLEAAGLLDLFETRVDGLVSAELGLNGKPEADIFTVAADNLGVSYYRSIVVEDAVSGVQAGKNGRFGLVLGIAREDNHDTLKKNGADIVVGDMSEISLEEINQWFDQGLIEDQWSIEYEGFNPDNEPTHEALLTVGNGYFGSRGALEECSANGINYPGTYIAGLYNRLKTPISGRGVENEDFINCPNWMLLRFKIDDGEWVAITRDSIEHIHRKLDFRTGILHRSMVVKDPQGRKTKVESQRLASMKNPHLAAMQYTLTPINYSGKVTLCSTLDGNIINDGVKRYRDLNQKHLQPHASEAKNNTQSLVVKTTQSGIEIVETARLKASASGEVIEAGFTHSKKEAAVDTEVSHTLEENASLTLEKVVALVTSKDLEEEAALPAAKNMLKSAPDFDALVKQNKTAWEELWQEMDLTIDGDRFSQKLIRLHLYHLIVSASPHNEKIDAGITARGLHGEAYRGHIFWDELFILPLYFIHFPKVARALLMYRYRRLDEAKKYAREHGYEGAMFPWQSGSSGREETQTLHLNPVSGKWGSDHSSLQRHVSLAITYNIWQYYHTTNDKTFIEKYGAEMFLEICRFWASKAEYSAHDEKYHIDKVMGPDEFHEKYPDKEEGGIKDNAYTNIMAVWSFRKAFELLNIIDPKVKIDLLQKLQITDDELARWTDISQNMKLVVQDDIIAQYDGYFKLKELDWDAYRKKYDNIYRMDRILKAEGKSADDYKVSKQADTLMTFYNLNQKEVTRTLNDLGFELSDDYLVKNLDYYLQRTSHGSTLSRVVHALLASMSGDDKLSWEMYQDALASDFNDIQGGTTGEGIHVGVMAGTVMIALTTYAGINFNGQHLEVNPNFPALWEGMRFGMRFKEVRYQFKIDKNSLSVQTTETKQDTTLVVYGKEYRLPPQKEVNISLKK